MADNLWFTISQISHLIKALLNNLYLPLHTAANEGKLWQGEPNREPVISIVFFFLFSKYPDNIGEYCKKITTYLSWLTHNFTFFLISPSALLIKKRHAMSGVPCNEMYCSDVFHDCTSSWHCSM